ncbi:DNA polymerase III subunit beta [bacterium]|nr:DNA polymerase III subunit beta [bacterium]
MINNIHFKCDRENILKGIITVEKAVALRNVKPILEGVFIKAENNKIILKATNLALSIETIIEGDILEEGSIVISARVFYEIISKYSLGEIDFKIQIDNKLCISNDHSKTFLTIMDADEFPEFPNVLETEEINLEENVFKNMINTTIFSSAISDAKPILKGVLFEIENSILNLVSLDGYRLAFRKKELDSQVIDIKAIIPSISLREVYKILGDDDNMLSLYISDNICYIKTDHTKIYTRLLEGDFIKYKNILPSEYKTKIKLKKDDIFESVERASILARSEKDKLVKFNIVDNILTITSTSELGNAYEKVDIYLEGKNIDIAFNAKYLIDAFKAIEDDEIVLEFNTNVSPCVIRCDDNNSYLYLILPVQMR